MCFEKPSDIRIWLMSTNHRSSNRKGTHTHTHILYIVVSTKQFPPMGESLFRWGVATSQPEHTRAHTHTHTHTQVFIDMSWAVSLMCGVNYKDVPSSVLSQHERQPWPTEWALVWSRLEDRQTRGSSWPLCCSDKAQPVPEGDIASCYPSSVLTFACLSFYIWIQCMVAAMVTCPTPHPTPLHPHPWVISWVCCLHLLLVLKHRKANLHSHQTCDSCCHCWLLFPHCCCCCCLCAICNMACFQLQQIEGGS